jgi:hypothetical protein
VNLPASLRLEVWERAKGRCEYCLFHEDDLLFPHQVDHIVAQQHAGPASPENLAFTCCYCNRYKGPNLASVDPETGEKVWLFDPRKDIWNQHFRIEGPLILGSNPKGRATVFLLQINGEERIRLRERLQAEARFPLGPTPFP